MAQSLKSTGWGARRWLDIALFALMAWMAFQWFGQRNSGPSEGTTAPDFALSSADSPSRTVSLRSLHGAPIVIEVVAPWCSACRTMAPRMAELARVKRERSVHFLSVAVDTSQAEASDLKRDWGLDFEVLVGTSAFSSAYRISVLPTLIFIDDEGRVRHVTTGITRTSKLEGWLSELGAPRS